MMALATRQSIARLSCRIRNDRRGATAIVFALGATALLGLVGLATEGGTWYLEKRHGQNAADAAATYGALALVSGTTTTPDTDAQTWVRSTFSYATGEATVRRGNYVSATNAFSQSGSGSAFQAVVTRTPARLFSGLFLATNPIVSETAVAVVNANGGNACVLAGAGGLGFAGSTQINVTNCALASNATGSSAISFTGNKATVSGGTLVSEGGCSNCGNSSGYMMYQPPTSNPYATIYNMSTGAGMTMPSFNNGHCLSIPTVTASTPLTPWTSSGSGSNMAYCGQSGNGQNSTLSTNSGNGLHFAPGTYFFQDASISFNGGTVDCTGCTPGGLGVTIILIGSTANKIGTIGIGGNASVTLNAPATNDYNTAFNGVLFYMDKIAQPTNGNGNAPVSISGNGNVHLTGGMYFPTVNVNYSGDVTSTNSAAACTEIIGWQLNMTGNSTLNVSGCNADGTNVAQTKSVQLVQ